MAVDLKAPLELKCKLRERPNSIGRRFILPSGKAVMGYNLMRVTTTGSTPTLLVDIDTDLPYVVMKENELYTVQYQMLATQVGGSSGSVGDSKVIHGEAAAKRLVLPNTAALVGAVTAVVKNDTNASAWTGVLTADTTNGGLLFTATGAANKTISWELALYLEIGLTIG